MRILLKKLLGWVLLIICLSAPAAYIWQSRADQGLAYQVLGGTIVLFVVALFASWLISSGERLS